MPLLLGLSAERSKKYSMRSYIHSFVSVDMTMSICPFVKKHEFILFAITVQFHKVYSSPFPYLQLPSLTVRNGPPTPLHVFMYLFCLPCMFDL